MFSWFKTTESKFLKIITDFYMSLLQLVFKNYFLLYLIYVLICNLHDQTCKINLEDLIKIHINSNIFISYSP